MKQALHTLTLLAVATFTIPATHALADSTGTAGPIVGIEINDDTSDLWGTYQGRVFINEGEAIQAYGWQGTSCSGYVMSTSQQEILANSIARKVLVVPYYKPGAGGARCLVSFAVTTKKALPVVTR
jgi:hypothetical protein